MADAVATDDAVQSLAGTIELAVTVWVGDTSYHLVVTEGGAVFGAGSAPGATLTVRQSASTAREVLDGHLNPQRAFLDGRIRVEGGADRLVAARPLMDALARATARVREVATDA